MFFILLAHAPAAWRPGRTAAACPAARMAARPSGPAVRPGRSAARPPGRLAPPPGRMAARPSGRLENCARACIQVNTKQHANVDEYITETVDGNNSAPLRNHTLEASRPRIAITSAVSLPRAPSNQCCAKRGWCRIVSIRSSSFQRAVAQY